MAFTSLIGMAKPRPSAETPELERVCLAVTMPMTFPLSSNRGPPELPGLMAQLVWSMFMVTLSSVVMSRSRADTMPSVRV